MFVMSSFLITHLDVMLKLGRISWPRHMRNNVTVRVPLSEPVVEFGAIRRALAFVPEHLFVDESNLRIEDTTPGVFCKSVGMGLFTKQPIQAGELICEYMGAWIQGEEVKVRQQQGKGDYILSISKDLYLDCYKFKSTCKASMVNSCVHAYDLATQKMSVKNSEIYRNNQTKRMYLKAHKFIGAMQEVITDYNFRSHSQYPDVLLYERTGRDEDVTNDLLLSLSTSTEETDDTYGESDLARDLGENVDDSF